jgi:hypothetical protein
MSDRQRNVGFDDLRVATGEILDGADPASDALETLLELVREQESEQFAASNGSQSPVRVQPRREDEDDLDEEEDDDEDFEDDDDVQDDDEDEEDWGDDDDWEEGDDDEGGDDEEDF